MNTTRPLAESFERTVSEAFARFKDPVSPEEMFNVIALNYLPAELREEADSKADSQLKEVYDLIDEVAKKEDPEPQEMIERIIEMGLESRATGWVLRRIMTCCDDRIKKIIYESKATYAWLERNKSGLRAMLFLDATYMGGVANEAMNP